MTEIKVLLETRPVIDFNALNNEERELFFEQLAEENPQLPYKTISDFAQIADEISKDDSAITRPTIPELLIRKIIELSRDYGSNLNTLCIPIIGDNGAARAKPTGGRAKPTGGRAKPINDKFKQPAVSSSSIAVRFDTPTLVIRGGFEYIAPSNEELIITGMILNEVCSEPKIGKRIQQAVLFNPPKLNTRFQLGNYNHQVAMNSCDEFFHLPSRAIATILGKNIPREYKFSDSNQTPIILGEIFNNLVAVRTQAKSARAAKFIFEQLRLALSGGSSYITRRAQKALTIMLRQEQIKFSAESSPALPEILKKLTRVHVGDFSLVFDSALRSDLFGRGFADIWYRSKINGRDSDIVKEQIQKYETTRTRAKFIKEIKEKMLATRNRINMYKIIIEEKFGARRLSQVEAALRKKSFVNLSVDALIASLRPEERKPVQLEYARREKYLHAVINNKCPHVKLYMRFRRTIITRDKQKILLQLEKYFIRAKHKHEYIKCNNCGFNIICPHVLDLHKATLEDRKYADIKQIMSKWINPAMRARRYYCDTCGEIITDLNMFEDISAAPTHEDVLSEELKNMIWGETATVMRFLSFDAIVNVPKLITHIKDAIYPYVFEIEKQILKSKTNTADEIRAKKKIYITIYAHAYIIHLIMGSKGSIRFKDLKTAGKNMLVDLIKHSLEIIFSTRNIAIREAPGMSPNLIKTKLIDAFKIISSAGVQVITWSGESEDTLTTLLKDPVFGYYFKIYTLDTALHGSARKVKRPIDHVDEVMGGTITKVEKQDDLFARAFVPKYDDRWCVSEFKKIPKLASGNPLPGGKNIYAGAAAGYTAMSFALFDKKVKSQNYSRELYIDLTKTKDGSIDQADVVADFNETFKEHREEFLKLQRLQWLFHQYRDLFAAKPKTQLEVVSTRKFKHSHNNLGRIYDEDGVKHKFDIYVWENPRETLTREQIIKRVQEGKSVKMFSDLKCSECGVLKSAASKLSNSAILESLDAAHAMRNFYKFFEIRCPRGGLHEMENSKCVKCGFTREFLDISTKDSRRYFMEFREEFRKETTEYKKIKTRTWKIVGEEDVSKYKTEYASYTHNFNVVVGLADKLKISHRVLSALGSVEKQKYEDVLSGKFIPPEPETTQSNVIYICEGYVKNLFIEYNKVKYYHQILRPPHYLVNLIEDSGIPRHELGGLADKLPAIYNEFGSRLEYFKRNKKPREIVDFIIQSLCEKCLLIYEDKTASTKKLRENFVRWYIEKIVREEELLSKPGEFNMALVYGDKRGEETYDQNYIKDDPRDDEFYTENKETEDEFGDTAKPFSRDSLDIDTADKEPEDFDNDIEVSGYELD